MPLLATQTGASPATSQIFTLLSVDAVATMPGTSGFTVMDETAAGCARSDHSGLDGLRRSWQVTMPSSQAANSCTGLCTFHVRLSMSADTDTRCTSSGALAASSTAMVRSNEPVAMIVSCLGFHATDCTLSVWCVKVWMAVRAVMSHSFTVASADALASRCRCSRFQARPMTASVWLPSRSIGPPIAPMPPPPPRPFFPFLPLPAAAMAACFSLKPIMRPRCSSVAATRCRCSSSFFIASSSRCRAASASRAAASATSRSNLSCSALSVSRSPSRAAVSCLSSSSFSSKCT
mmetsp:Transcript_16319/g.57085  ORF Transcript_16319/g.57085 Transcript_16319/m.57085 type:complete len:291 (-) Transcript_16319:903-1775(-)